MHFSISLLPSYQSAKCLTGSWTLSWLPFPRWAEPPKDMPTKYDFCWISNVGAVDGTFINPSRFFLFSLQRTKWVFKIKILFQIGIFTMKWKIELFELHSLTPEIVSTAIGKIDPNIQFALIYSIEYQYSINLCSLSSIFFSNKSSERKKKTVGNHVFNVEPNRELNSTGLWHFEFVECD